MGGHNKPNVGAKAKSKEPESVDLAHIEERRGAVRAPTFKAGEVLLPDGVGIDCIVRNVSESGCLIKLENAATLPERVRVRIDLDTPPRPVEIVWRSTTLAGAMFIREPS